MLLLCAVILEGGTVFSYYAKNEKNYIQDYRPPQWSDGYHPVFSYQRPLRSAPWSMRDVEGYGAMQDTSGFNYPRFTGSRWVGKLLAEYPTDAIEGYVRNKFIVYERGFTVSPHERSSTLERIFKGECGGALVEGAQQGLEQGKDQGCEGSCVVINKDGPEFKVLFFGLNNISFETNWPVEKYLVYNDTYSTIWQARVNSHPVPIDLANAAFKGIRLAAGRNIVEMNYGSPLINLIRVAITWGYVLFA